MYPGVGTFVLIRPAQTFYERINVDSRTTASLMELLTDLNDEGTTVILITHDREVAEMSTRQVTLNDGRIEADSGALFGDAHG